MNRSRAGAASRRTGRAHAASLDSLSLFVSVAAQPATAANDAPRLRRHADQRATAALLGAHLQARGLHGATRSRTPHGAPRLRAMTGPPVALSMSHTAGCVAVATAVGLPSLGVDAEPIARLQHDPARALHLAARLWPNAIVSALRALPARRAARAFLELWCLHEALAKCTERGLVRTPFCLRPQDVRALLGGTARRYAWLPVVRPQPLHVRLLRGPHVPRGFVLAVAAPAPLRVCVRRRSLGARFCT